MQRRRFISHMTQAAIGMAVPTWATTGYAQETAPGVTDQSLTIASSLALTGTLAGFGQAIEQGAGAAFAQVNAQGGVHGRQLKLALVDDGYDPERTVANVKKILQEGSALALLSCVGTANNTAITPLIETAGIPHVAPISGAASLRKDERYVFHVRAGYTEEMQRLVQRLVGMGLKGIAVVYLDNGYGREMHQVAIAEMQKNNASMAAEVALNVRGDNLDKVLQTLKQARPSAVLLATAGTPSLDMVRGIKQQLPGVLIAGLSVTLHGLKLDGAASGVAVTTIVPDPDKGKSAVVRDYQAAMRAIGHQEFSSASLEAYINARVLIDGLRRVGKDPAPIRLRAALASIRNFDLGGFVVDYGGQPPFVGSRYIDLGVLGSNGRFVG